VKVGDSQRGDEAGVVMGDVSEPLSVPLLDSVSLSESLVKVLVASLAMAGVREGVGLQQVLIASLAVSGILQVPSSA